MKLGRNLKKFGQDLKKLFPELAVAVIVAAAGPAGVRQECQVIRKSVEGLKNRLIYILNKLEAIRGLDHPARTTQRVVIKK